MPITLGTPTKDSRSEPHSVDEKSDVPKLSLPSMSQASIAPSPTQAHNVPCSLQEHVKNDPALDHSSKKIASCERIDIDCIEVSDLGSPLVDSVSGSAALPFKDFHDKDTHVALLEHDHEGNAQQEHVNNAHEEHTRDKSLVEDEFDSFFSVCEHANEETQFKLGPCSPLPLHSHKRDSFAAKRRRLLTMPKAIRVSNTSLNAKSTCAYSALNSASCKQDPIVGMSCLDDVPTCIRIKRNRPPSEANQHPIHVEWFVDKRRKLISCPTTPHHRGRPPE